MINKNILSNTTKFISNELSVKKSLLFSSLILVLFFMYNLTTSNMFLLAGMSLMLFCVVLVNVSDALLVFISLTPSIMMLKIIGSNAAIFGYLLLLLFFKSFVINAFKIRIFVGSLVFLLMCIITFIVSLDTGIITQTIRTFTFFVFFLSFFRKEKYNNINYKDRMIRQYIFGILMTVILGILFYAINSYDLLSGNFAGIKNDRNYFSANLANGISISILYLYFGIKKNNLLMYITVGLLFLGGILSASRTFLLSMIIVLVMVLLLPNVTKKIKFIFSIISLALIIIILLGDTVIPAFKNVLDRLSEDDIAGGNGRFEAWAFYLNKAFSTFSSALFGSGNATKLIEQGVYNIAEHNTFIQSIYSIGIFGTLSYFSQFGQCNRIFNTNNKKHRLFAYAPLIITIFCYCGVSSLFSDNFNMAIVMNLIVASYCNEIIQNKNIT